jgi:peptidoglycan/LPS O-acetylase OafA/YrhL
MASSPRTTINSLQAGRGLAAMAVVFHHAGVYVSEQAGGLPGPFASAMSYGYLGVDFFFVLSGFIIYHTNSWRVSRPGWLRDYTQSRLTRIYLPYWPIGLAIAVAYTLLPQISRGDRQWEWFSTLTLLPAPGLPALSVAWTLQHEILFYALACLMLWSGRVLLGSMIWAAAILLLLPFGFSQEPGISPIDLEFLFGIAGAWCLSEGRARRPWLLSAIGAVLLVAFFMTPANRVYSVVFGLGLAFILLPVVRLEESGRLRIAAPFVLFGNASYAIYLIHLPILSVLVRVGRGMDPILLVLVGVAVSAAAGIAYHKLLELPVLNAVRRRFRTADRREAKVAAQG